MDSINVTFGENFVSELSTSMFTASGVVYVFYCCDEFLSNRVMCVTLINRSLPASVHCLDL
jgi:hypothetical protein